MILVNFSPSLIAEVGLGDNCTLAASAHLSKRFELLIRFVVVFRSRENVKRLLHNRAWGVSCRTLSRQLHRIFFEISCQRHGA